MDAFKVFLPGGSDWHDEYRGDDAYYGITPSGALFATGTGAAGNQRTNLYAAGSWLRVEGAAPDNLSALR